LGILDPKGRHDVHHRLLSFPGLPRSRALAELVVPSVATSAMSPLTGRNQVASYLSCFAASALYEGVPGKLYPKVVGVVELRSIRHSYDKVLQRKPVKPLRALCPDQVGDEGIDVVAPGQALAGDLIEALKAV
jgi:hypothetical protein